MFQNYEFVERLGHGEFSSVFKVKHRITNKMYAMKMENNDSSTSTFSCLKHEAKILKYIASRQGKNKNMMQLHWFGYTDQHFYLVLEHFSCSLHDFLSQQQRQEEEKQEQNVHFAMQLLQRIHELHECNVLHRDIKPSNVLVGNTGKLVLSDFGFSMLIFNESGVHFSNAQTKNIIGTAQYISVHVHELQLPSRRDDVESILYIIFNLLFGSLPWSNSHNVNEIKQMKHQLSLHFPSLLTTEMIQHTRDLEFNARPNYKQLMDSLLLLSQGKATQGKKAKAKAKKTKKMQKSQFIQKQQQQQHEKRHEQSVEYNNETVFTRLATVTMYNERKKYGFVQVLEDGAKESLQLHVNFMHLRCPQVQEFDEQFRAYLVVGEVVTVQFSATKPGAKHPFQVHYVKGVYRNPLMCVTLFKNNQKAMKRLQEHANRHRQEHEQWVSYSHPPPIIYPEPRHSKIYPILNQEQQQRQFYHIHPFQQHRKQHRHYHNDFKHGRHERPLNEEQGEEEEDNESDKEDEENNEN